MQFYCIWKENIHCWWDLYPIAPLHLCQLKWRAILQRDKTLTHTQPSSPHPSPLCFYRQDKCSYIVEIPSVKVHLQCSIVHSLSNRILSLMGKLSGILFTLSCILSSWGQRLDFTSHPGSDFTWPTPPSSPPCLAKEIPINHCQWL